MFRILIALVLIALPALGGCARNKIEQDRKTVLGPYYQDFEEGRLHEIPREFISENGQKVLMLTAATDALQRGRHAEERHPVDMASRIVGVGGKAAASVYLSEVAIAGGVDLIRTGGDGVLGTLSDGGEEDNHGGHNSVLDYAFDMLRDEPVPPLSANAAIPPAPSDPDAYNGWKRRYYGNQQKTRDGHDH